MPGVPMPPHQEGPREGPSWLKAFLNATYFTQCQLHAAAHKSEKNFFCTECAGDSLCSLCVQKHHSGSGHTTMQIRRSSYHEVVRISDVQRLIDISAIQVYVINSAKIVFLNGRPQAKPQKGAPYYCETCHRTLLDSCRFCSIGCKLAAIRTDPSVNLQPRVQPAGGALPHSPTSSRLVGDTEVSGDSGPKEGEFSLKKVPDWRKRPMPPLLLDDRESGESSEGSESGELEGHYHMKRRRSNGKAMQVEEKCAEGRHVALPLSPTSSLMPPGTPPQSAATGCPWKVLHRRKGIPHRSPLW